MTNLSRDKLFVTHGILVFQCNHDNASLCDKFVTKNILIFIPQGIITTFKCYNFQCDKRSVMITQEMCPIRAEISTHKKIGKMYLFVICMICRHWFQTKLLLYIAEFWRFWGKNIIFFIIQSDPLTMNSVSLKTRVIWSKMKFPAKFLHNPLPKTPFYINRIIWNPVLSEGIFQSAAD